MALLDRWPAERRARRDPLPGTSIEQLTGFPAEHRHLASPESPMTPSGDLLLFTSDRARGPFPSLFCLQMDTGEIVQVTDTDRLDPEQVTPATNGRQAIAALRGEEAEIAAVDLETGEWETLAGFVGAHLKGCHRSASGEYVVTVVTRQGDDTVTAVHTEGMRTVPILESAWGATCARFSPDARNSVLYVTRTPAAVRCVEFDGSGDREIGSGVQAFGRSGVQDRQGTSTSTSTTRTPERLNARTPEHLAPFWLGSGDEVVWINGSGEGPLVAAPRAGGRARVIASGPFRWARSDAGGERIVAVAATGIVLIDPRSGEVRGLVTVHAEEARPCFSPDGRSVIYTDRDEQGHLQIFLVHVPVAEG